MESAPDLPTPSEEGPSSASPRNNKLLPSKVLKLNLTAKAALAKNRAIKQSLCICIVIDE